MSAGGTTDEEQFMLRAIKLAARGRGRVEPNPLVGAVVVKAGRIVGEGFHRFFGGPHAETEALSQCGSQARGATMYVNLEPCCHHGKTPPCTDAIIAAGIRRVVVAVEDPAPHVNGKGLARLKQAGIQTELGLCRRQGQELNAAYFKLLRTGRPYVTLKWAQSLDGKLAYGPRGPRWISNLQARRDAHKLRALADAVLVGIQTVLKDDPQLTVRLVRGRSPTRIVLDSSLCLPPDCRLVETAGQSPVIVATASPADPQRAEALRKKDCEILQLPATKQGLDLAALLDELGRRKMTNVLVEGGPTVLNAFLQARLADAVVIYVAPVLIGQAGLAGPVASARLQTPTTCKLGDNVRIRATIADGR